MSIQDTATKQYVSEVEVFADAFNYLIYDCLLYTSDAADE